MSLRYRFFGVPCRFRGRPVDRIQMYVNAVVTVHEPGLGPNCIVVHTVGPRAGDVVEEVPPLPRVVGLFRPEGGMSETPIFDEVLEVMLTRRRADPIRAQSGLRSTGMSCGTTCSRRRCPTSRSTCGLSRVCFDRPWWRRSAGDAYDDDC